MSQRRFAEDTKVPVQQSIDEIQRTIARYGGDQVVYGVAHDKLLVGFTMEARQVRFTVPQDDNAQNNRRLARALLLVLKAKLEAVASGVTVFEDEFLANIVLPDGHLVGAEVRPKLALAYQAKEIPPMLPSY